MCGIVGVVAHTPVNQLLYDGLLLLQHRGQDAAGIVTSEGAMFHMHKGPGYVRDVFRTRNMRELSGKFGIGHCRYPTAGSASSELEAQPFYVNSPFGITLAHNGNLTNSEALKRELFQLDFRHVNTNSDSEVLLNVLALELERAAHHARLDANAIFNAVAGVHKRCRGAYAIVAMIAGYGMLAFRDPFGIRPLIIGVNEAMGGTRVRRRQRVGGARGAGLRGAARRGAGRGDLRRPDRRVPCAPVRGESGAAAVHLRVRVPRAARLGDRRHVGLRVAAAHGRAARAQDPRHPGGAGHRRRDPDSRFEPAVGARAREQSRPQVSRGLRQEPLHRPHVHHARAGDAQEERAPEAESHAASSSRTRSCCWSTIRSSAARRRARSCRWRARPARARCTSRRRARRCAIPNVYGIDMPNQHELVATGRTEAEIAREIGADLLDLPGSRSAEERRARGEPRRSTEFEASCFDGKYITGDITADYLSHLAERARRRARPGRHRTCWKRRRRWRRAADAARAMSARSTRAGGDPGVAATCRAATM